ncbi:RNA polymerase sigma factor SigI [Cytobacillus horneckiae]|uniref:RNA polymerase sigma factor SigI n=1 Tax=Cytobacillus horneckiae TaxID=549687 RepID=UPI00203D445E|nr:RNA polymerase sigma factor SigI [Cytobacillus horneckiae]MCM3178491.1 RNA polymerase sigma factor SigI [Cytobacillus horneckiae]
MLNALFKGRKREKSVEEMVAEIQDGDESLQNQLIDTYKPFIAKTVSSVCRRYIYESDDEFSIGLIAFNEAINKYSPDKGASLISFAEIIIKRRVIDYIRQQSRHKAISLDLQESEITYHEQASALIDAELSIKEYIEQQDQLSRKEEILQFTVLLEEFGLTFKEIVHHSPKHADARKTAMEIAQIIAEDKDLKKQLFDTKRLPIKQLELFVSSSRKTIERNRKYIIAMTLILCGEFIYLRDYLKGVLET